MMNIEEIAAWYRANGVEVVSVGELSRRVKALGYTLDRTMDCYAPCRFMTGELAGQSYPCCTTNAKESDTGLSFANFQARRDANFRALQELRQSVVAISRGAILEI